MSPVGLHLALFRAADATFFNSAGVSVPGIRMVNAAEGMLGIEWIEGKSVRTLLPGAPSSEEESPANQSIESSGSSLSEYGISPGEYQHLKRIRKIYILTTDNSIDDLMKLIGSEIAKMHQADIIHSDLTTSNLMLRHPSSFKPVSDHVLSIQTELVLIFSISS
jgi:tRNA A-37 threonylcarbamoyl transferase component Bud32